MDLSIIISLLNEEESLRELTEWIHKSIASSNIKDIDFEIIFINDGSTDGSWKVIRDIAETDRHIKAIAFRRNYGKAAALHTGFAKAEGNVVITMDADLQDSPEEIPELYRMITEEGWDIVSGWKKKRYDNVLMKNIPSKLYNWTARKVSGLSLHDMNCGLKAYRKEVVKDIELYGDMHRYVPFIAKNAGYTRITEKVVIHQKRKYGQSKFGLDRFVHGLLDLMTLWFLGKFGKKPMHVFGFGGLLAFFIGAILALVIIIAKLVAQAKGLPFRPVTDQPLFYLALATLVLGFQMFLTGFLGELISRSSQNRNEYKIRETIR